MRPLVECVELHMIRSIMDTARFNYCVLCVLQKPLRFLANYKNPCWHETVQRGNTNKTVLRCLPYYMISGQAKCGTTDLYFALIEHPSIEQCIVKDLQWWAIRRFSKYDDACVMYDNYVYNHIQCTYMARSEP